MDFYLSEDGVAIYHKGKKIVAPVLYLTPTLHYVQHVAPHVAKRLVDMGIEKFYTDDEAAGRIIELACGGKCRYARDGADIGQVMEYAYYNYLADKVVAAAIHADALVLPCADKPLARALARRAREAIPGITLIAAGRDCPDADHHHDPTPIQTPIPLGPTSRAVLATAIWAIDEGMAEAPVAPLLDVQCTQSALQVPITHP